MITLPWLEAVTILTILHTEKFYTSWLEANHAGPTATKVDIIFTLKLLDYAHDIILNIFLQISSNDSSIIWKILGFISII